LAHLITILISPILTRLFSAEDFGELQLFQSLVILFALFSTGCYHYVIVSPKKESEAKAIAKGIILFSLAFATTVFIVGISLYSLTNLFRSLSLTFIILLPITIWIHSVLLVFDYWFIRNDKYSTISFTRIVRTSSSGVAQVLNGILSLPFGLIWGLVLGRILTLYFVAKQLSKSLIVDIKNQSTKLIKKVATEYKSQPFFILPSTLISTGSSELVIFLIAGLFGQYELGIYALAYRVLSAPSAFIGTSFGEVLFKETTTLINTSKSLKYKLLKTWGLLFIIALFPVLALSFYGDIFITIIFGNEWLDTGYLSQILAPLLLINFISAPTGKLFISLNDQNFTPYLSALILFGRIGGLILGYFTDGFFSGVQYMVYFHITALLIYNGVLWWRVMHYENKIIHVQN
jgi:O-antigen/teichoic acid export membrane protein